LYFAVSLSWYSRVGWHIPLSGTSASLIGIIYAQHVSKEQGQEENPKHLYVLPFKGVE
jgi:hypothetical protein